DSVGPSDAHVNNFNTVYYNVLIEILCTSDGFLINEGGNWIEYTYGGLPAWSAVGLDPNNILVLLGDGSWSDGVYKFNLTSHQFDIVEWIPFPNFLHYCEFDSTYYAGGEYGMWKSADGLSFTSIDYFDMKECVAFAYFENHFVVSADGEIYCSPDSGETWVQASIGSPPICDMSFHDEGTLYGIFPGESYSSGLWSSIDFGENWDVEFWDVFMSSVGVDAEGNIFVGWENNGIAQWNPVSQELEFFNDGLPDLNINKITTHPDIDCINIVACTDNGAYLLTNYLVGLEENKLGYHYHSLSNYPNPFDYKTTIVFSIEETCSTTLSVYNMLGNNIATLFSGLAEAGQEYKFVFSGTALSEGIYYCQLQSGTKINAVKKMMLVR
ncbi:MAG: T9SS type A sorting domain-containing protein, partial [Bacteroidales bacterium]|nr:T9SS type A sorting domain-containing protein [Bacteroidales bacterium]